MRGTIGTVAATMIIGAALLVSGAAYAQSPGQLERQRKAHFPVMHGAIQELEHTKRVLQSEAASDFHGHKSKAITHIDAAIQELKAGIQSDAQH